MDTRSILHDKNFFQITIKELGECCEKLGDGFVWFGIHFLCVYYVYYPVCLYVIRLHCARYFACLSPTELLFKTLLTFVVIVSRMIILFLNFKLSSAKLYIGSLGMVLSNQIIFICGYFSQVIMGICHTFYELVLYGLYQLKVGTKVLHEFWWLTILHTPLQRPTFSINSTT